METGTQDRLCPHFGVCGGCSSQDRPYPDQLAAKENLVRETVAPFSPREFRPIRPSPDVFYYRNKMDFAFAGSPDGLGLREKNKFNRVVNLQECFLMSPETPAILEAVRRWIHDEKLSPYHLTRHTGLLRYLVLREGKNTGERMAHLVTSNGEVPRESFLRALDSAARVDTVAWSVNAGVSDVARGESTVLLRGSGTITETLGERQRASGPISVPGALRLGTPFRISPTAFFQTNTRGAEVLYREVSDFLGSSAETLMDFYCGSGTIGLFCASKAKRIIGVEVHPPAVEDARKNAEIQGVPNAEFHAMDAAQFAKNDGFLRAWRAPGTVAVMDPPRPGLGPQVRRLLLEHPVEKWVYVSCNPRALAMDLPLLVDAYRVEIVQPVDLFPHTPHVETALLLYKK